MTSAEKSAYLDRHRDDELGNKSLDFRFAR
jgi:hypothetical protein